MFDNFIATTIALLTFVFSLMWLRAAAEAAGLVGRFILHGFVLQDPSAPMVFLVFGLLFMAGSLVTLASVR